MSEFGRRYPPDLCVIPISYWNFHPIDDMRRVGLELSGNARVWNVYQDRINELDGDTIMSWNDTLNFILVFVRV